VVLSAVSATGKPCIQSSFNFRIFASPPILRRPLANAYECMRHSASRRTVPTCTVPTVNCTYEYQPPNTLHLKCKVSTSDLLYFLRYRLTRKGLSSNHLQPHTQPITQLAQFHTAKPQTHWRKLRNHFNKIEKKKFLTITRPPSASHGKQFRENPSTCASETEAARETADEKETGVTGPDRFAAV